MGDFPLLSRKISPYILRNEHHSAFKRKISAYFPNEETRQLWQVLLFYIPIPIRLSFRHVFYEKLFKTESFNDFSICFFVIWMEPLSHFGSSGSRLIFSHRSIFEYFLKIEIAIRTCFSEQVHEVCNIVKCSMCLVVCNLMRLQ
jgi:hypothetical protein